MLLARWETAAHDGSDIWPGGFVVIAEAEQVAILRRSPRAIVVHAGGRGRGSGESVRHINSSSELKRVSVSEVVEFE